MLERESPHSIRTETVVPNMSIYAEVDVAAKCAAVETRPRAFLTSFLNRRRGTQMLGSSFDGKVSVRDHYPLM